MAATKRKAKGKCLRGLWASERGGVAMYLGFAMLFILPMMAGAISVSQIYTLNTMKARIHLWAHAGGRRASPASARRRGT